LGWQLGVEKWLHATNSALLVSRLVVILIVLSLGLGTVGMCVLVHFYIISWIKNKHVRISPRRESAHEQ
jgi:hypothetical protein